MRSTVSRSRSAFTLIELLVVIAIIAVLVGLLLPAVQKVREAAARMSCSNNMKQLALGVQLYASNTSQGTLPPGAQGIMNGAGGPINGTSWLLLILPQIEQGNLRDQYVTVNDWTSTAANPGNAGGNAAVPALSNRVPTFYCPSGSKQTAGSSNTTHYYGIMGNGAVGTITSPNSDGAFPTIKPGNGLQGITGMLIHFDDSFGKASLITLSDVTDGTSNTFMAGERSITETTGTSSYLPWTRGNPAGSSGYTGAGAARNITNPIGSLSTGVFINDLPMASNHTNGANFAMGDGSVRFVTKEVGAGAYFAASTINNGKNEAFVDLN